MKWLDTSKKEPFEEVYGTYYDKVYKYVYSLVLHRENAEDIVADTFVAAYRNYDSYDPQKASVGTWLFRIAHNNAVNFLRSAAYRTRASLPEQDLSGAEDRELLALSEENEDALRLYAALEKEEVDFLNMRYALELRDAEVAEILHLNVKTVNKRYQRLLTKCRKILNEEAG